LPTLNCHNLHAYEGLVSGSKRLTRLLIVVGLVSAGCAGVGPATVSRDRFDYNGEVARSWKEQILLNIVRSRYYEVPVFLDLGQIVSGYTLQSTVNLSGTAGTADNSVTLGGGAAWSDHPTITYTPLSGAQFNRNMMTPIPPSAVLFSIQSGWPADLVFSLAVGSINGVGSSSEPARFERAASVARALQQAQLIGMRVQPGPRDHKTC
jgi:hypothetical protein